MVLLQSVIAYTFMERHWQLVTRRLSAAVTADVAALIDIYESYPQDKGSETLERIASERLNLDVDILAGAKLPAPGPRPFFSLLDEALSDEIHRQIARPFWIDTVGRSSLIEIRVEIPGGVMRVIARRSQAYASNSHIFLLWMGGSSMVLLGVAILFLRNQIRPILRLADVAESFGKGRELDFRPRGAREVRKAGHAFIEMKRRIERAMEQRTTMLNGVSHDLRTIITRFRLSLVLLPQTPEIDDLQRDVDEMSRMLEAYLAFRQGRFRRAGRGHRPARPARGRAHRRGAAGRPRLRGDAGGPADRDGPARRLPALPVQPRLERRPLRRHDRDHRPPGGALARRLDRRRRTGHPARAARGGVQALRAPRRRPPGCRGSGLGLAIALDIARAHGGDVALTIRRSAACGRR